MHDHNFEKQVQQKMEELSLSPSDAVWENVEDQLHKKKDRRIIFWLPLFLIPVILCGYFCFHRYYHPSGNITLTQNNQVPAHSPGYTGNAAVSGNNRKINPQKNEMAKAAGTKPHINDQEIVAGNPENHPILPSSSPVHDAPGIALPDKKAIKHPVLQGGEHQPAEKIKQVAIADTYKKHRPDKNMAESIQADRPAGKMTTADEPEAAILSADAPAIQADEVLMKEPSHAITPSVLLRNEPFETGFAVANYTGLAKQTVKLSKKTGLKWGFSLQAGKTSVRDGKLNTLFAAPTRDFIGSSLTLNQGNNVVYTPSTVQPGFGFSAGFFFRKQLNRRVAVSTGITYTRVTTSLATGNKVDSVFTLSTSAGRINQFYPLGESNTYTNRYHFIELPVSLQLQLNRGKIIPLIWEAGVSFSELLASNALHYNSALRKYYTDNHLFNRAQLNFLIGLYLQAFSGSRHTFRIGPKLQYGVTPLYSEDVNNRNHLLQYGCTISMVIK